MAAIVIVLAPEVIAALGALTVATAAVVQQNAKAIAGAIDDGIDAVGDGVNAIVNDVSAMMSSSEVKACEECQSQAKEDAKEKDSEGNEKEKDSEKIEKPELETNPKHETARDSDFASKQPKDVKEIYDKAIPDKTGKHWYAKDSQGNVHRFTKGSNGKAHWTGASNSTRGLDKNVIDNAVKKKLKIPLKGTKW